MSWTVIYRGAKIVLKILGKKKVQIKKQNKTKKRERQGIE